MKNSRVKNQGLTAATKRKETREKAASWKMRAEPQVLTTIILHTLQQHTAD